MAGEIAEKPYRRQVTVTADTPLHLCPTSLDVNDDRQKAMIFGALNPASIQFQDGVAEIVAVDWLVYPDEGVNEQTGEVETFGRLVLFDRDGRTLKTSASHAARTLRAALALYSEEEWDRGLHFRLSERQSKRPNRVYHAIEIVPHGISEG